MTAEHGNRSATLDTRQLLAMAFFCGLPTIAMLQRFSQVAAPTVGLQAGWLTGILMLAWGCLLFIVLRYLLPALQNGKAWRLHPDMLFLLGLAGLFIIQLWIYPMADSGELGFYSDRDEALDIGARQLLQGQYPYSCHAVSGVHHGCPAQGNPILPLPGALVLSMPFVLISSSAVQVFFWLALLYVAAKAGGHDSRQALLYIASIFVLSPILLAEIVTGGDLISNTLAVSSLCLLLVSSPYRNRHLLIGFLLGVSLSWRAHFLLVFFPLLGFYLTNGRLAEFVKIAACTALGFGMVTLPLYLWDPSQFAPVRSSEKLSDFSHLLPRAEIFVPLLSAVTGLVLGSRCRNGSAALLACGLTVMLPALAVIVLKSIKLGHPSLLFYGWYTMSGLILGTAGVLLPGEPEETQ